MPTYKRIPASDRWDIVNYVRYLNQGLVPAQTAQAAPPAAARDAARGSHAVSTALVAAEQANPRSIPGAMLGACLALVAIGVVAFLGGLATDPATAWRAFHVNYLYFGALAQGGVVVACAFVIIGAQLARPGAPHRGGARRLGAAHLRALPRRLHRPRAHLLTVAAQPAAPPRRRT